jgi:hypothetical protein
VIFSSQFLLIFFNLLLARPFDLKNWSSLHFSHTETQVPDPSKPPHIHSVYFPYVAMILPRWLELSADESSKHLILISGSGTPQNPDHCVSDNSTEVIVAFCFALC